MKQKYCIKCLKPINENNHKEKYVMFIVKAGKKIYEFRCFHISCWKEHFGDVLDNYREGERVW